MVCGLIKEDTRKGNFAANCYSIVTVEVEQYGSSPINDHQGKCFCSI